MVHANPDISQDYPLKAGEVYTDPSASETDAAWQSLSTEDNEGDTPPLDLAAPWEPEAPGVAEAIESPTEQHEDQEELGYKPPLDFGGLWESMDGKDPADEPYASGQYIQFDEAGRYIPPTRTSPKWDGRPRRLRVQPRRLTVGSRSQSASSTAMTDKAPASHPEASVRPADMASRIHPPELDEQADRQVDTSPADSSVESAKWLTVLPQIQGSALSPEEAELAAPLPSFPVEPKRLSLRGLHAAAQRWVGNPILNAIASVNERFTKAEGGAHRYRGAAAAIAILFGTGLAALAVVESRGGGSLSHHLLGNQPKTHLADLPYGRSHVSPSDHLPTSTHSHQALTHKSGAGVSPQPVHHLPPKHHPVRPKSRLDSSKDSHSHYSSPRGKHLSTSPTPLHVAKAVPTKEPGLTPLLRTPELDHLTVAQAYEQHFGVHHGFQLMESQAHAAIARHELLRVMPDPEDPDEFWYKLTKKGAKALGKRALAGSSQTRDILRLLARSTA